MLEGAFYVPECSMGKHKLYGSYDIICFLFCALNTEQ